MLPSTPFRTTRAERPIRLSRIASMAAIATANCCWKKGPPQSPFNCTNHSCLAVGNTISGMQLLALFPRNVGIPNCISRCAQASQVAPGNHLVNGSVSNCCEGSGEAG